MNLEQILIGAAEEAAELSQACIKLYRAISGVNPTPVTREQALENLHEEVGDLRIYLDMMGLNQKTIEDGMETKRNRMAQRLADAVEEARLRG